jgi:p-hydroxybenzoate 3-monooxygenase
MSRRRLTATAVGIVGAGPAGLLLSHLLALSGIDSVVVDHRTRAEIENTVRAGILERDSVRLLVESGVSDRVLTQGHEHAGIDLRFDGVSHRVDFQGLVGESVWLYPQNDVFTDLADARERGAGDVRFGIRDTEVVDITTDQPGILVTGEDGARHEIRCGFLVGADGSRSICRTQVPEGRRRYYFREYPFAWFGVLAEAPPSAPVLVYTHSERGFALISQRSEVLQRLYFQCDPDEDAAAWSEDRIWAEFQARVAGEDGFAVKEGRIIDQTVLKFRSFVGEPMRHGNLLLAGDAAHTVPPTGAKGLNLALADVRVLAEALERAVRDKDPDALDEYGPRALARVWKAQHFSYWMTTMLHLLPNATPFDIRRQTTELESVVTSAAGSAYLAEGYTGWPSQALPQTNSPEEPWPFPSSEYRFSQETASSARPTSAGPSKTAASRPCSSPSTCTCRSSGPSNSPFRFPCPRSTSATSTLSWPSPPSPASQAGSPSAPGSAWWPSGIRSSWPRRSLPWTTCARAGSCWGSGPAGTSRR